MVTKREEELKIQISTAKHPNCRCRCGGALHDGKRLTENATREDFEALPEDDPHHLPTVEERKQRAKLKRVKKDIAQLKQEILPMFTEDYI